ncbi:MAG: hypothetical protein ACRD2B_10915 [Terriglobia bacterium]
MDALEEFDAIRNIAPAEFGRTTGGIVQMASKSGTNAFHGNAFYYFRNGDLTALDAFGNQAVGRDQQVGGTLGGPISKDRTFFFIAPEIQVAHKPVQILYSALDTEGVQDTPGAQALLGVAPEGTSVAVDNSQSVLTRVDHKFSDANTAFVRFDFTHAISTSLTGSDGLMTGPSLTSVTTSALSNQTVVEVWSGTLFGQLTSALSSNRLNELRLQLGREDRPRTPEGTGPQVTVENGGAVVGVYGPQATGVSFGNGEFPSVDNRDEAADDFSIISGAHTVKFGGDILRIGTNATYDPGANGAYTFTSLSSFLARQPFSYTQFTGSGALKTAVDELGFFAQDEWRVLPPTISYGFRYEAELNPNYLPATAPQDRSPGATTIPDQLKEFEPRLGVAWDVRGNGKTVVRAGGGIYYGTTQMPEFAQSLLFNGGNPNLGLGYAAASTNPTLLQNAFAAAGINLANAPLNNLPTLTTAQYQQYIQSPSVGESVYYMSPNWQNPRSLQWKGEIDRELAPNIILGVDFTYINTVHLPREIDMNLPTPVPDATGRLIYSGTRPLAPQFGFDIMSDSSARALYRAVTISLNIQRRHFVIGAYYTQGYNLSDADAERPVGEIEYDSAADLNNEYNWSNIDIRHQFTATDIFYLPFGMELSGAERFQSGLPFSGLTGTDSNLDGQLEDRPLLNGSVIKRNTYRNEPFYDVDVRVDRRFPLPNERGSIIVSADFFNLFNFANVLLAGPALVYRNNGTVFQSGDLVQLPPVAAFDQLRNPSTGKYYTSNTPGDPFQAQLGVEFEF